MNYAAVSDPKKKRTTLCSNIKKQVSDSMPPHQQITPRNLTEGSNRAQLTKVKKDEIKL